MNTGKFYDRKKELNFFKSLSEHDEKKLVVLYGRRRIGKTTLLRKAFPEAFYYFVETRLENDIKKDLSMSFSDGYFNDWTKLFSNLFKKEKIIILDEFQNFYKINPDIFSSLQHAWDENKNNCILITCGSHAGMMKKIFTELKNPLYGRADNIINLQAFSFDASYEMLKDFGYSIEEIITMYGIMGGIPKYLWYLKNKPDLKNMIYEIFISDFAPLKEEAKNLLISEFGSEHKSYFSVLQSLGISSLTPSEIGDLIQMEDRQVSRYLNDLVHEYKIVKKINNELGKNRKSKYEISEPFMRFWFYFINRNIEKIEFKPESVTSYIIEQMSTYMGKIFEEVCREVLQRNWSKIIDFEPDFIGNHWGKIPGTKNAYEIDIICGNDKNILYGECKWTNKKIGIDIYELLKTRAGYTGDSRKKSFILFSKSGFDNKLKAVAAEQDLILINLKDIENIIR